MYKIISNSIEILLDPDTNIPYEAECYKLENGTFVIWEYKSQSWRDKARNEYTAVTQGQIIGFNRKNTIT